MKYVPALLTMLLMAAVVAMIAVVLVAASMEITGTDKWAERLFIGAEAVGFIVLTLMSVVKDRRWP